MDFMYQIPVIFFCWLEVVSPWNFFNFFPLNGLIYNPVEFHLLQNMLLKQTLECNTKSYLEWISLITRLQIKVSHSLLNYLRIRSHYPLIVMIWVFLCLVCRKISCIKGKEWKGNRQVNNQNMILNHEWHAQEDVNLPYHSVHMYMNPKNVSLLWTLVN